MPASLNLSLRKLRLLDSASLFGLLLQALLNRALILPALQSKMQPLLRLLPLLATLQALTIIEQSLHKLHRRRPQPRRSARKVGKCKAALLASDVKEVKDWRNAVGATTCTVFDAVDALKLVHDVEHLREVQAGMSRREAADTDTYCAPGSWEAVLDGTRAWADAVALAVDDEGPAFALSSTRGPR